MKNRPTNQATRKNGSYTTGDSISAWPKLFGSFGLENYACSSALPELEPDDISVEVSKKTGEAPSQQGPKPEHKQTAEIASQNKIDDCCRLAQQARHSFVIACRTPVTDESEAYFAATINGISELWAYSIYRDTPFRDLLAALEVAVRHKEIEDISESHKEVLKKAFQTLTKWHISPEEVSIHLDSFVKVGIDLSPPVRPRGAKKIKKITIEYED